MSENTNALALIPLQEFMKAVIPSLESNTVCVKSLQADKAKLEGKVDQQDILISKQQAYIEQLEKEHTSQTQVGMNLINLNDDEIMLLCKIINREKCIVPGTTVYIMKVNLVVHWRAVRDNWDTFITENKTAKEAAEKKAKEAEEATKKAKEAKKNDPKEKEKREEKKKKSAETRRLNDINNEPDEEVKKARIASHFGIQLSA